MAKILNEAKSSIGSPYAFYTIYADEIPNTRTVDTVQIDITVYSHLQYSQSYLGSGYPLTGYLTLNGTEYSIPLKASNETWSGTTQHRADAQFTVSNLVASQTTLSNVKFRVMSRSTSDSGYLPSTSCENIAITIGHNIPSDISYTMTETNPLLISAGVSDDIFVENLSQKEFNVSYTLHDGATMTELGVINRITYYSYTTNPFTLDLTNIQLNKWTTDNTKIPIIAYVRDNFNTQGTSSPGNNPDLYSYIAYTPVSILNTSTMARRVGQLSGQVAINVEGNYYNGSIGNVDHSSYKPTIKYKYWKLGDTEPSTYANTISASDISISNGSFSVSSLNIGSTTETDPNFFDPEYAYRIKLYIEDGFTSLESNELQIQVGEATWTEYKDRVDFKAITLKGANIVESGSNSNGSYVKYADGTMICWKTLAKTTNITNGWGSLYESSSSISLGDWAEAFYSKPTVNATKTSGQGSWLELVQNISATSCGSTYVVSAVSRSNASITIEIIGIGRWKQ